MRVLFSISIRIAYSNLDALKAILEALIVFSYLDWSRDFNLIIESDSKVAISWTLDVSATVWKHEFVIMILVNR